MDAETVAILFFLATLAVLAAYAAWRRWLRLVRYKIDYDVEPEVPDSAFSAVLSRVRMIHIITTLFLLAALWVILSNRYDEDVQKWAFGAMGSILGFWLRPND
jgi:hypothetical protein